MADSDVQTPEQTATPQPTLGMQGPSLWHYALATVLGGPQAAGKLFTDYLGYQRQQQGQAQAAQLRAPFDQYMAQGDPEGALAHYQRVLPLYMRIADPTSLQAWQTDAAKAAAAAGSRATARNVTKGVDTLGGGIMTPGTPDTVAPRTGSPLDLNTSPEAAGTMPAVTPGAPPSQRDAQYLDIVKTAVARGSTLAEAQALADKLAPKSQESGGVYSTYSPLTGMFTQQGARGDTTYDASGRPRTVYPGLVGPGISGPQGALSLPGGGSVPTNTPFYGKAEPDIVQANKLPDAVRLALVPAAGMTEQDFNNLRTSSDPAKLQAANHAEAKASMYAEFMKRNPQVTADMMQAATEAGIRLDPVLGFADPKLRPQDISTILNRAQDRAVQQTYRQTAASNQANYVASLDRKASEDPQIMGHTWIDPRTYDRINPDSMTKRAFEQVPKVAVDAQDGAIIGQAGNMLQQAQYLQALLPRLKKYSDGRPGVTFAQALDLMSQDKTMTPKDREALVAQFKSLQNALALEATKIITNSSRPGVTIFQNLKESEVPQLTESLENSVTKTHMLLYNAHNQIRSRLGIPRLPAESLDPSLFVMTSRGPVPRAVLEMR